ncbi:glycine-rich protein 1-like [Seriola aureovittata]|uniref:glycine-rich protein 1-like n=1 Tax=Seriola aureovittata TaxID=2871759 RepID=UPI0024BEDDF8|nr:glycine-rich protein 1-like [Seriola aureovittata]
MGNVLDSEGGSVDDGPSTTSTTQEDKLIISLKSFMLLYHQHDGRLQRASESFAQAAARLQNTQNEVASFPDLLSLSGGAVGGVCGGFTGGVGGALGAVAAATCARLCGKMNAVDATVGFVGSVFGGVAGGVFSGSVGGAVGVAVEASSNSFHGAVNKVVCFTIGLTTGGAIGGIFGGPVGAAGGAAGGGFGALCGTGLAVYLVGGVADSVCGTKDSREDENRTKNMKMIQKAANEFSEGIKPLVQQLKTVQMISDEMTSSANVQRFTRQTAKTLAAVTAMQKTISDSQRAKDPTQFVAEAARKSRKITEELRNMSTEAENLLFVPRKLRR